MDLSISSTAFLNFSLARYKKCLLSQNNNDCLDNLSIFVT